ncbi:MAG: transglycosylase domain-containing protein [Peptococcaceae bacterium]|jgi:penicillin-binding protein 1A|nr:transglycosylase domain-containing protein [Peptococcaceae bacterium]
MAEEAGRLKRTVLKKTARRGIGRVLLAAGLLLMLLVTVRLWLMWKNLPKATWSPSSTGSSILYDVHGQVITTLHGAKNTLPVTLNQIPPQLQLAVMAVEDHNFYINHGFDLSSIFRAALADIKAGMHPVQGASTITEQLAKELFLSDRKTISRKIEQFMLGLELQHGYTKSEILQKYLNVTYFGQGAYGVGAASQTYFGTGVAHLDLAQSALLAGVINAPSLDDPLVHPTAARDRQRLVLADMARYGYITPAQEQAALAEKLHFVANGQASTYPAPYFVDYVIEYLNTKLGLPLNEILSGGLRIYTTLDPRVQAAADSSVAQVMNRAFPLHSGQKPNPQAAALTMDPRNGYILAMVGGRTHPGLLIRNRAITGLGPYEGMLRQPGSSIKPLFTYTPAIVSGLTEMTVMDDVPFSIVKGRIWPENDDHLFRGYMTLRHALAISDNNVAVRTLARIGVNNGFSFARNQFHLTTLVPSGSRNDDTLAATLGGLTKGVSLEEMVAAYSELANGGTRVPPVAVLKVEKADGSLLYSYQPRQTREFSPQAAYIVTKMLEKVLAYGTGSGFPLNRPAAGKTGTTNNGHNGWFIGYTPQMVTGVWTGYSNRLPKPPSGFYGATYSGPIWHDIMTAALAPRPVEHFTRPPGIVTEDVSIRSGLLPGPYCPPQDIKAGLFIQGTQPTTHGEVHVPAVVSSQNPRLLWAPGSPGTPETRIFWRRPSHLLTIPAGIPPPDIIVRNKWVPVRYAAAGSQPAVSRFGTTAPVKNTG